MHWVMCTNSDGKQILVNLFQVVSMSRAGNHTVLTYAGGEGCAVVVTEEPRDILVKTRLG